MRSASFSINRREVFLGRFGQLQNQLAFREFFGHIPIVGPGCLVFDLQFLLDGKGFANFPQRTKTAGHTPTGHLNFSGFVLFLPTHDSLLEFSQMTLCVRRLFDTFTGSSVAIDRQPDIMGGRYSPFSLSSSIFGFSSEQIE